ncbi:MAG TPA: carboxypeptidase-like regulatory domain-containing protein [Candidatus Angelobacter sp.]|nr:carboxypeptidase-like regulatory domain-containing protein [Candidatus Angelobacter sp.]
MRLTFRIGLALFYFTFSATLFAAQITGTVSNGSTNKPSSGDNVVLLSLSGGMDEVAHTKTDATGHFTLTSAQQGGPYLVRVEHQGVNYFQRAQGSNVVDVTVYDAAKTIDHLVFQGRVFRFQTMPNGRMEVSETFILSNESSPPRTKSGSTSFDFDLPPGAQIEEGVAEGPGGMPTSMRPIPVGGKNRYGYAFPLRPGRTRFQVTYNVPYAGTREFKVTPELPLTELGIMLPKSMQFNSSDPELGHSPDVDGMTVFVGHDLPVGKELKFSISGEGTVPTQGEAESQGGGTAGAGAPPSPATQSAESSSTSRWYVIGIFVIAIVAGGYWLFRVQRRSPSTIATGVPSAGQTSGSRKRQSPPNGGSAGSATPRNAMLEAIKEELFELEKDRAEGKLSQADYEGSKASLETLLRRHLKKN